MKDGRPPIGFDGKRVELHHMLQEEPGPLAEVSKTLHGKVPNKQVVVSFRKNPNLNASYESYRSEYWEIRVKDFEP